MEEGEEISRAGGGGGAAQWFGFGASDTGRWMDISFHVTDGPRTTSSTAHREQPTGGRSTQATYGPSEECTWPLLLAPVFSFFFPFS